jgi:predicted amidohydrolase
LRLLLTALNCPKGHVQANLVRHHELLQQGKRSGCDLVLLPEMSLTGYLAGTAMSLTDPSVLDLVQSTAGAPSLCFGLVECAELGGTPYITQLIADHGRVTAVHRKATLGEGESGMFRPGQAAGRITVAGVTCSVAVCAELGTQMPYQLGATLVLGPAAPGLYGGRRTDDAGWQQGFDWWRGSVIEDAKRILGGSSWLAVSTQAGATDDEDFPGWAALIGPGGVVVEELPDWQEGTLVVDLPSSSASAECSAPISSTS